MKKYIVGLTAGLFAFGLVGFANASLINVDADAFAVGTDLSNAFSGITLSVSGSSWAGNDGNIYGRDPNAHNEPFNASTGSLVFGTSDTSFPHLFMDFPMMRVDFNNLITYVGIDYIANDSSDQGVLEAYNAGGVLLGSYTTAVLSTNNFETMSFASSGDIAYILAGGLNGGSSGGLDNLNYDPIPEPTTMLLLGTGLVGVAAARRRKKNQA